MGTKTIMYDRIVPPGGEFRPRTRVRVRLVAADSGEGTGYNSSDRRTIVGVADELLDSELFVVDLDAQASISAPANTAYEITRVYPGWPAPPTETFTAPTEPTPTSTTQAVTLPAANIAASTTGFASSGAVYLSGQLVTYTATTPTAFTGCTGGAGLIPSGTSVRQAHWIASHLTNPPTGLPNLHVDNPAGAHAASAVAVAPTGGLVATTAQAALAELDGEVAAEAALARNADNLTSGTVADARIAASIARDSEVSAAVAAEAALARNADNLTSGTVADARIAASIARDSEVSAAVAAEAALARNADNLTSGTVADARIAASIARDSEVSAAVAAEAALRETGDTTRSANQQVANYTLVLSDAGKAVEGNAAGALNFTVPPNSSVAYPTGTIIEVVQVGAGAVSLVQGSGVTITGDTVAPGTGGSLLLRKTGTNAWFSAIASVRSGTYVKAAARPINVMSRADPNAEAINDGGDHALSERFGSSLAAAQAVFPAATALTEQIDHHAIQLALNETNANGGGQVDTPPGGGYGIESTLGLKIYGKTCLQSPDGSAIFRRVGANTTLKMLSNANYGDVGYLDQDITIRGVKFVGTGDTLGVSDQGSALAFFRATNVLLEDVETDKTNGDGIQWRQVDGMQLNRVRVGSFGRNGISPTSGLRSVWNDVEVYGSPLAGATPGIPIDCEPNSATEPAEFFWTAVRAKGATFVDFYSAANADFLIRMSMELCSLVGFNPGALRLKSTNKTFARHFSVGPTNYFAAGTTNGSAILLDNVGGAKIDGPELNVGTATGSPKAITFLNTVDGLALRNPRCVGFSRTLFCDVGSNLSNARIQGRDLGIVRIIGSNNELIGSQIGTLEISGAASINNIIETGTRIGAITALDSADLTQQHIGSTRGLQLKSGYSIERAVVNSGGPVDLVVPLPSAAGAANGRLVHVLAGYSHVGHASHWASLLVAIRYGDTTSATATVISNTAGGAVTLVVQAVSTTSVTLRLTYTLLGILTATVIG